MKPVKITDEAYKVLDQEREKKGISMTFNASKAILEYFKPKKQSTKHIHFDELKQIYCDFWNEYNKTVYQWNGVIDNSALNKLIRSLERINTSTYHITDLFKIIMSKLPEFYKDKSINAINKNLNGIIAEIKNGRNKNRAIQNGGIYDFTN